jgi:hypothetical protein
MTAAALVLLTAMAVAPPQETAAPAVDLHGKLYRSVFVTGPATLTATDVQALPQAVRDRLSRYLTRRTAFTSRYTHDATSFDQARVDAKRREIERALVALIDAPGIEDRARDFVQSARIAVEWEGSWKGPLEEAAAAEDFLKRHPSSALAPYLYVFIAQRQRAAFEAYAQAQNVEGMKGASKKYRTFLQRARSASDPIFTLLVDDMDRQPHIYLKTDQHPATFDPDA